MSVAKENSIDVNQLNETGSRAGDERRQEEKPVKNDRREVQRRRQIDPTTCERDYSNDEIEFMQALDIYKRNSGRMFPTCSEILEVLVGLGYRRMFDSDGNLIADGWAHQPQISAEGFGSNDEADDEEFGEDDE